MIDIHCHTFNADDIPVYGFLRRVVFDDRAVADDVARLVDLLIQGRAPGYKPEKARLDRLLGDKAFAATYDLPAPARRGSGLDAKRWAAEVDAALLEVQARDPAVAARLDRALSPPADDNGPAAERRGLGLSRAIEWVLLFGEMRLDITTHLATLFGKRVDLFCPSLVDLEPGLGDTAETTVIEQIVLHEKISRLSMRGLLPGARRVRIHPFVGFDPRREVRSRLSCDVDGALRTVKLAIERYGFIGIKLYPPMGWKPIGNTAYYPGMTEAEAAQVDEVLRELYTWCVAEDVPLLAHCNRSVAADDAYCDFASPENWVKVLQDFRELRLDLGHFGGARKKEKPSGWPWQIARAVAHYPNLYADVGNHEIHDPKLTKAYMSMLERMFRDPKTAEMRHRLMFGSDWYMLALYPEHARFLQAYEAAYAKEFGADATRAFLGGTALRFLGFDDPTNGNTRRLRRYYEDADCPAPEWLASE